MDSPHIKQEKYFRGHPSLSIDYQDIIVQNCGNETLPTKNFRKHRSCNPDIAKLHVLEVVHLIFLYLIVLQTYKKSNYTKVTHG